MAILMVVKLYLFYYFGITKTSGSFAVLMLETGQGGPLMAMIVNFTFLKDGFKCRATPIIQCFYNN